MNPLRDHYRSPKAHHLLGHLRALLEVVRGAGGDVVLAVDDLLGQTPTKRNAHAILQVLLRVEAGVQPFLLSILGTPEKLSARVPLRMRANSLSTIYSQEWSSCL